MKKAQKLVIDDMITMNITCGEITSIVIEVPFPCDPLCIGSSYGQQSIQYLPHFSARVYGQQNKQCKENNHILYNCGMLQTDALILVSLPGLPHFFFFDDLHSHFTIISISIYYCERKPKNKNGECGYKQMGIYYCRT